MAMGGSSSPPKAVPVTPVPQEDDPQSLETKRGAAMRAKGREGHSAHLMNGRQGVPQSAGTSRAKLVAVA